MNIRKCDVCKKDIQIDSMATAGVGFLEKDFYLTCGKPILDFLKKHKFISKDNKRI